MSKAERRHGTPVNVTNQEHEAWRQAAASAHVSCAEYARIAIAEQAKRDAETSVKEG